MTLAWIMVCSGIALVIVAVLIFYVTREPDRLPPMWLGPYKSPVGPWKSSNDDHNSEAYGDVPRTPDRTDKSP